MTAKELFYKHVDDVQKTNCCKGDYFIQLDAFKNALTEYKQGIIKKIDEITVAVIELYPYKRKGRPETYDRYHEGWEDGLSVFSENIKQELEK